MPSYPDVKTDIVNGVTETDGNQVNNIEDYVGIKTDTDPNTITYKLTNPASIGPGHKHPVGDLNGGTNGALVYKDPADDGWKAWLPDTIGLVTKTGEQTIADKKTFGTLPEANITPTSANQLTRKKYIDDLLALYVLPKYGAMSVYANATPLGILEQDNPMLIRNMVTGLVNGFTFNAGSTGAITAFATGAGSTTLVTSAGHGLLVGSSIYITINGTTNYNGLWYAVVTDVNTLTIPTAFVADDATGDWVVGSYLKASVGSGGVYKLDLYVYPDLVDGDEPSISLMIGNSIVFTRAIKVPEGDLHNVLNVEAHLHCSDFVTVVENDIITLALTNTGAAVDITVVNAYLNLIKIGV